MVDHVVIMLAVRVRTWLATLLFAINRLLSVHSKSVLSPRTATIQTKKHQMETNEKHRAQNMMHLSSVSIPSSPFPRSSFPLLRSSLPQPRVSKATTISSPGLPADVSPSPFIAVHKHITITDRLDKMMPLIYARAVQSGARVSRAVSPIQRVISVSRQLAMRCFEGRIGTDKARKAMLNCSFVSHMLKHKRRAGTWPV